MPVSRVDLRPGRAPDPRQAHRGSRGLLVRGLRAGLGPPRDLAGLRLPQSRPGRCPADRAARRPRRAVRSLRLHRAALRQADRVRRRGELEVHRRELQRVLPLPGRPSPAQQADPVRRRRRLRSRRCVAGWLDGIGRLGRDDVARRGPRFSRRASADGRDHPARRALRLLLPRVAHDVPVDPPGLPARPSARAAGRKPDARHLRLAVRGRDDGTPGFRPERRDRVLGPDQRPGLARLRAPAAGDPLVVVGRRSILEPGSVCPRVRPDGRGPLCRCIIVVEADRPRALRPTGPEDEPRDQHERRRRDRWDERHAQGSARHRRAAR